MQVILLEDVRSLGKKGDIVKVSDGYARNYILPKKLGVEANTKNLNDLKLKKASDEKIAARQLEEAKELAAKIEASSITLSIRSGGNGKAFGSVSGKEIATAAQEQLGLTIDKKKLVLSEPIKNLGEYDVPVKLHKDVTAKLKVKVVEA